MGPPLDKDQLCFENSMSSYLIEQLRSRPKISLRTHTQVVAAHGEASLEAAPPSTRSERHKFRDSERTFR